MKRTIVGSVLLFSLPLFGQILDPILGGGGGPFTLTATTVGSSQTVTIQRLTLNGNALLNWGDGGTTTITSGNTGAWTHVYAAAGAHAITLPNARMIVGLGLQDAQLGGLNTSQLRTSALNYFDVIYITGSTVKSSDMRAWRPTTWYLLSMPAGTYSISSADMSAWRPTNWELYSMPTGTYSISSADMSAWRPTNWQLGSMPAGTYSISSADMGAWRPTNWYLYSMPTGTYSISSSDISAWTTVQNLLCYSNVGGVLTISAYTDFTGLVALHSLQVQNNSLAQASVDAVLKGLWTARASFTYATPSLTINGTNAAPSGIYQSNCPTPATGKEWAYDLVHETCAGGGHVWTVATN